MPTYLFVVISAQVPVTLYNISSLAAPMCTL
jgi:hypothetical protein